MSNVQAYRLPTAGKPGTGKYPTRIRSHGMTRDGTHHFELYNGSRYIVRGLLYRTSMTNLEFRMVTGLEPADVPQMSLADYAGVLFLIRTIRALRNFNVSPTKRPEVA